MHLAVDVLLLIMTMHLKVRATVFFIVASRSCIGCERCFIEIITLILVRPHELFSNINNINLSTRLYAFTNAQITGLLDSRKVAALNARDPRMVEIVVLFA